MTDLTNVLWRESSLSGSGNNCVEVASVPGLVAVRDSKDFGGAVLTFSKAGWAAFLGRARTGDFDAAPDGGFRSSER